MRITSLVCLLVCAGELFAQPAPTQRYACGLPAGVQSVTDAAGVVWSSDSAIASGGFPYALVNPPGSLDATPEYKTMRYSATPFSFRLSVAPGAYRLRLQMIEPAPVGIGGRLFTVTVNGAPAVFNLDLFAVAGSMTPAEFTVPVSVTGSAIYIALTTTARNAIISAIALDPASSAPPAAGGVTIAVGGMTVGTQPTVNLISGNGMLEVCSNNTIASRIDCTPAVDANYVIGQDGTPRAVVGTSTVVSGVVQYLAGLNPVLLSYAPNKAYVFLPNVSCGDSPAVNIDGLGPIPLVKLSAGALVPLVANDCISGVPYIIIGHNNAAGFVDQFVLRP